MVDSRLRPRFSTRNDFLPVFIVGWNRGCCACRVPTPLRNYTRDTQDRYLKTRRHSQNRKYIRYRNAARGGPSHGHRQHAQKLEFGCVVFQLCERIDRQTNNTSHLFCGQRSYLFFSKGKDTEVTTCHNMTQGDINIQRVRIPKAQSKKQQYIEQHVVYGQ